MSRKSVGAGGASVGGKSKDGGEPAVVQGLRMLDQVFGVLSRLNEVGCKRDKAKNRHLRFGQYAGLVLVALFNPTMQSLRSLSQLAEVKNVQKKLGGGKASLGSLSESVRVFDPEQLWTIYEELLAKIPQTSRGRTFDSIPRELAEKLVAADGSALRVLPQIVAAVGKGKYRLHLQFDVWRGVVDTATVTRDEERGESDERDVLAHHLQPDRTLLLDRGYEQYSLLEKIVEAGSDYVARVQDRPVQVRETRPVSEEARAVGVVKDEIVELGQSRATVGQVTHCVRRLHLGVSGPRTPSWAGHHRSQEVVLLTNLVDVPAEVIAAMYRLRWQIELFFRFFKHVLGCRKLISTKPEGVAIQVYCTLIAALLMALVLGRNVTLRDRELIQLYLQGWADEEDVLRILASRRKDHDKKT